ncbi:hypothetical protein [Denitratimonas sp. CY0512]|uniref:AbiU2 domain-containing protein n=1 Tax=Denitratimonas sp. CY0512 TaxID=3131940 RepID=UPI0030978BB3
MAKPQSITEVLKLIGNELHLLWAQMDTYQTLYLVDKDKRQQLMAETAPGFFVLIQATLIESLLLRICRLLDPAEQNGNANVSFETLWLLLAKNEQPDEPSSQKAMRLAVRELLDDWSECHCNTAANTVGKYGRLKKLRRKVLAHNDFTLRRRAQANELWAVEATEQDYELVREVAGRLWSVYRKVKQEVVGRDEVEPRYAKLHDQPVMLLRQLASGICLDKLVDANIRLQAADCLTHHIGDERQQKVFGSSK